jgi:hypothetical protein
LVTKVSRERVGIELDKMLGGDNAADALRLMFHLRLFQCLSDAGVPLVPLPGTSAAAATAASGGATPSCAQLVQDSEPVAAALPAVFERVRAVAAPATAEFLQLPEEAKIVMLASAFARMAPWQYAFKTGRHDFIARHVVRDLYKVCEGSECACERERARARREREMGARGSEGGEARKSHAYLLSCRLCPRLLGRSFTFACPQSCTVRIDVQDVVRCCCCYCTRSDP